MADVLSTLTVGLGSLDAAKAIIQGLRATEKAYDQAELRMLAGDLMNQVADARLALADAKIEICTLRDECTRREDVTERRKDLIRFRHFYYDKRDGKPWGNPYCNRCNDVDLLLVHLEQVPNTAAARRQFFCPECKNEYESNRIDERTNPEFISAGIEDF